MWPRVLRRGSAAARLPGLWVRVLLRAWISVPFECCVLSGTTGCSLVQRSATDCGVSECDHESSIMRRPLPIRDVSPR